jgi:hypothetical protein
MRSIVNNGKSDGSTQADYTTMALLAVVPALLQRAARARVRDRPGHRVTVGELLQLGTIESVRVVEISRGVIRAAPLFDFANFQVSRNPRVEVVHSDAYRAALALARSLRPDRVGTSNPWGTGVEMLYSAEFLAAGRAHLAPGGVFAQWIHTYETDAETIRARAAHIRERVRPASRSWFGGGTDLLLLGFDSDPPGYTLEAVRGRASQPPFVQALARSGIDSLEELLVHELFPIGVVNALGSRVRSTRFTIRVSHTSRDAHSSAARPAGYRSSASASPRASRKNARCSGSSCANRGGSLSGAEYAHATEEACSTGRREMCTGIARQLVSRPIPGRRTSQPPSGRPSCPADLRRRAECEPVPPAVRADRRIRIEGRRAIRTRKG